MEYNQTLVDDLWSVLNTENLAMNQEPSMTVESFIKSSNTIEMSPALSPAATVPPSPAFSNTSDYSNRDYPSPTNTHSSQPVVDELNWISQCIMDNPDFAVAALESDISNNSNTNNGGVPINSYMTPLTVPQTTFQPPVQPQPLPTPPLVIKTEPPTSPKHTTAAGGRPRQRGHGKIVIANNTSLDESELTCLPVRELNKRLQGCGRDEILKIKQKRRTLKNRGYAQNCRTKRMVQRSELEEENLILMRQLSQLRNELHKTVGQRDMYRAQCESLRHRNGSESTLPSSPDSITFT